MIVEQARSIRSAFWRGFGKHCPACGHSPIFHRYLEIDRCCAGCGEELHHHRADDAPPYFAIVIVGHVIIPLLLVAEKAWHPPLWVHFSVWLPATAFLTLWLLPRVKGAVMGLQWALRMHGFGSSGEIAKDPVRP